MNPDRNECSSGFAEEREGVENRRRGAFHGKEEFAGANISWDRNCGPEREKPPSQYIASNCLPPSSTRLKKDTSPLFKNKAFPNTDRGRTTIRNKPQQSRKMIQRVRSELLPRRWTTRILANSRHLSHGTMREKLICDVVHQRGEDKIPIESPVTQCLWCLVEFHPTR